MARPLKTAGYLRLIGRISVDFSRLEMWLRTHIWEMIGEDHGANLCITAGSKLMDLANLFRALFRYRVEETDLLERLQLLYKDIETINAERNRYLHSEWFFAEFDGTMLARRTKVKKTGKLGLVMEFEDNKSESLRQLLKQIKATSTNLALLMNDSRSIITEHRISSAKSHAIRFTDKGMSNRVEVKEENNN